MTNTLTGEITKKGIIALAESFKDDFCTNDPFIIAEKLGIDIGYLSRFKTRVKQACTIKPYPDKPAVILINPRFNKKSQKVLCAHELGHALFHEGINHFDGNPLFNIEEEQANLFAVALLTNKGDYCISLESMSNYHLKAVLDHNIQY